MCVKYCAATTKWGQVIWSDAYVTQNHLSKAEDLMLQNATSLRKSAPWHPNIFDTDVSCAAHARRSAALQIFFKCPTSRALFEQPNFQKQNALLATTACNFSTQLPKTLWTWGVLCIFVLLGTAACNFSSLILPDASTPAALASLLFWPSGLQNIAKTKCFATFLLFARFDLLFFSSLSFLFWLFLFADTTVAASVQKSDVWLLNFVRLCHVDTDFSGMSTAETTMIHDDPQQSSEANLAHYEKSAVNTAKLKHRRPVVMANISTIGDMWSPKLGKVTSSALYYIHLHTHTRSEPEIIWKFVGRKPVPARLSGRFFGNLANFCWVSAAEWNSGFLHIDCSIHAIKLLERWPELPDWPGMREKKVFHRRSKPIFVSHI